MKKRVISLLLVLLVMALIFHFSSAPAVTSSKLSYGWSMRLLNVFQKITHVILSQEDQLLLAAHIEVPLRKMAHFLEYALLGICMMLHLFCLQLDHIPVKAGHGMVLCCLYAISDELHQYFVPGRSCQFRDICIDSLGSFVGIIFMYWILRFLLLRAGLTEKS